MGTCDTSEDCVPSLSGLPSDVDSSQLSPFSWCDIKTSAGDYPSGIHCFYRRLLVGRRGATLLPWEVWENVRPYELHSLIVTALRQNSLKLAQCDLLGLTIQIMWYILVRRPRLLHALLRSTSTLIRHVYPPCRYWSIIGPFGARGMNMAGIALTVIRDRLRRGEPALDLGSIRNAVAVASVHHRSMPGVALPSLTDKFDPTHFPQITNMSAFNAKKVAPTVGDGVSFAITGPSSFDGMTIVDRDMDETTGDFTRAKAASRRHWKSALEFTNKAGKKGQSLRFTNVKIPWVNDKRQQYASPAGYVYAGFDAYVRKGLEKLLSDLGYNVQFEEDRVKSTTDIWWKTMNNLDGTVGKLDNSTNFVPVNIREVMKATSGGIVVHGEFMVHLKAHTDDGSDIERGSVRKVSIDILRVYIRDIGVQVPTPPRESTTSSLLATRPIKAEVTPDDVMAKLAALGL